VICTPGPQIRTGFEGKAKNSFKALHISVLLFQNLMKGGLKRLLERWILPLLFLRPSNNLPQKSKI
jgi:hypothetical protein